MIEKKQFQFEFKSHPELGMIQGPVWNNRKNNKCVMLIGNTESDKMLNFTLVDKKENNFQFKTVIGKKSYTL